MPAGDAQRVWFPEMIEDLKRSWSKAMNWRELADFCELMTQKRDQICQERGIQPPKTRCSKCGELSRSAISDVSIRSALFALKNNGVITDAEFKALGKSWLKYKAKCGLDPYGRKTERYEKRAPGWHQVSLRES